MGWEVVDEVGTHSPVYYQTLGVTSTLLILLCYACRRGLGLSVIHDRCEMFINGSTEGGN